MVQELRQRQERIAALDKVEPYGATAQSRAASETANTFGRLAGSMSRMLGQLSQTMAVNVAQRQAFKIDPETGTPQMPDKRVIGGLNAMSAYQKTLDGRYEASLRTSLLEKLKEAEINNLYNEEGYRQDAAIVVGAMHDKVAPNFQTAFTEMAAEANARTAGNIAYRQAMQERADARAAARQNAAARANEAAIGLVPDNVRQDILDSFRSGEEFDNNVAAGGIEFAENIARINAGKAVINYGKHLASLENGDSIFGTYETEDGGAGPEVQSELDVGNLTSDDVSSFITSVDTQFGPQPTDAAQEVINQTIIPPDITDPQLPDTAEGITAPTTAPGQTVFSEAAQADVERTAAQIPMIQNGLFPVEQFQHPIQRAQASNSTAYNLISELGMPNRENVEALGQNLRLANLPFDASVAEWNGLSESERTNLMTMQMPGSENPEWWFNPENLRLAEANPVSARMLEFVETGYLPTSLGTFFTQAASSTSSPTQAEMAGQWWSRFGHGTGVTGTWANLNPEKAGLLDAYGIIASTQANLPAEERLATYSQVQENFRNNGLPEVAKALGMEGGKPSYYAVEQKVRQEFYDWTQKQANNVFDVRGLDSYPAIDPNRFEEMIPRLIATTRAMGEMDIDQSMKWVLQASGWQEVHNLRGQDGQRVQGGIAEDLPQVNTVGTDSPRAVFNSVAAKVVQAELGIAVDPNTQELTYKPSGDGTSWEIWINNENTHYSIERSDIDRVVTGVERSMLDRMTGDGARQFAVRSALLEEHKQLMQMAGDGTLSEAYQARLEEVQGLLKQTNDALSLPSTVELINAIPVDAFAGWFGGR